MKATLVVLLVIGVASAVPLKNPRYNVQNLQNLLTQQNFNLLLQYIQQNQDLYQGITTNHQAEYQLLAQWLASQSFILPRFSLSDIQSFLDNLGQNIESLDIDSILANLNIEQLLGSSDIQLLFANIDFEQVIGSSIIQSFQSLVQPFLTPQIVTDLIFFTIQHPTEAEIIANFLSFLDISYNQVIGQIIAGTYDPQQYLNPEIEVKAFQWAVQHLAEFQHLAFFLIDYVPIDQITESLFEAVNTILNNVLANLPLNPLESFFILLFQLLPANLSLDLQQLLGSFIIQPFLIPQTMTEFISFAFAQPNNVADNLLAFFTSLDIDLSQIFVQIFTGTYNPQEYFNPEMAVQAFQWAIQHPIEFIPVGIFLIDHLPIDQITEILYAAGTILENFLRNLLTNHLPSLIALLG